MEMVFRRQDHSEGFCGLTLWCRRLCPERPGEEDYSDIPKDQAEQPSPHSPRDQAAPRFPAQPDRRAHHQEDDVDLEALMNGMNVSLESLYPACSMQSETAPLRQNGQHTRSQPPPSGTRPLQPQVSQQQKVQRSQPVHILAVRRLQEEDQQLRTSSLPAIPNPFPELCGAGSPPALTPGSVPPSQAPAKQIPPAPGDRQAQGQAESCVPHCSSISSQGWMILYPH